jgi:archaellum component FlaF (FlaF/FlaG flagellin family)
MKDIFVSYGRRESLIFVGNIHQKLKLSGYEVWFDKVNIPDGDDYSQRISHGIESAHNFAYVMAPRCMTSPYCLIELEYAKLLGKRIIPVAQILIFDTPPKELAESDKQVMRDFYKAHHLPDIEINTELDVLKRSHALLGKADWVYARQEYNNEDIKAMFDWQSNYENYWYKHDDIGYFKEFNFPSFGVSIDNIESVCESLIRVMEKHKSYTIKHTQILVAALAWQQKNQSTEALLVGKDRKDADNWLLTEFIAPEQAPCTISDLQADFICESRKNAENLYTDVFVCYDAANKDIREKVQKSLSKAGITTWIHYKDIAKSENYDEAINRGIEQADNLLFFISNDSMQSEYCIKELRYALLLNKRVIPLLIEPLNAESQAVYKGIKKLQQIQYIDFTNNFKEEYYQNDIRDLLKEIQRDRRYHEQHKVFLVQALKWENQGKNPSILLRGYNLQNAQTWLKTSSKRTSHKPIVIQEVFINESAAHAGEENIDVFLSYSRNDGDFARKLNEQLQINGRSTWFDQDSIASGADFQKEIYKGIATSNNFVFLISEKSITSPYCADEVAYAAQQGKRIITLRLEKTESKLPASLAAIQWIEAGKDKDFGGVFSQIIRALDIDRTHIEAHSKWQNKALEWKKTNKDASLLLLGSEFSVAELWLKESLQDNKQPQPTEIQQEFIEESRKAIEAAAIRENQIAEVLKKRLKVMRLALGAAAILLLAALVSTTLAFMAMKNSNESAEIASTASENAKEEARRADSLSAISLTTAGRLSSFQGQTFRLINLLKLQYEGKNYRDSIKSIIWELDPANKVLVLFEDALHKYGFKDTLGNVLIPAFFDEAKEFENKKAQVRVGEGRYILSPDGTRQIAQETNRMWEWQTVQRNTKNNPSKIVAAIESVEKATSNFFEKLYHGNQKKSEHEVTKTVSQEKNTQQEDKKIAEKKEEEVKEKTPSKLGRFWRGIVGKGKDKDKEKDDKKDDKTISETVKTETVKTETVNTETANNSNTNNNTANKNITDNKTVENIAGEQTENLGSKGKFRIPKNAVSATLNPNESYNMYVMRARHKDMTQNIWGLEAGLQVGYITSDSALYSYNGKAIETNKMEILVLKAPLDQFAWVDLNNIKTYEAKGWGKLQGGWEETGQPIFVTRVSHSNGEYSIGKGVKACGMYAKNGKEIINCDKYEVLMYKIPEKELKQVSKNEIQKVQKYKISYFQDNLGKITGLESDTKAVWKWVDSEKPANFKFRIPAYAHRVMNSNADTTLYIMRVLREDGSAYIGNLSDNIATYCYNSIVVEAKMAQVLTIEHTSNFEWMSVAHKESFFANGYSLVQGGWEADGLPIYIARANYLGKYRIGQILGNKCKIAIGKNIVSVQDYELLVHKK